jgi:hypothetical protein
MPKQQDIRALVDQFVSDLSTHVREQALETVRAALGDGAARRGPGRPRKAGKRGPGRPRKAAARRGPGRPRKAAGRVRRSSADLEATADKLLAHVRANAGQRLEEIGRELDTPTAGLKRPIQMLVAEGKLRTEGQKRGTRYFAGRRGGKKTAGRKRTRRAARRRASRKVSAGPKSAAKRKLTPEQRAALLERLAKARAARRASS